MCLFYWRVGRGYFGVQVPSCRRFLVVRAAFDALDIQK
jgi:hypothetical protein